MEKEMGGRLKRRGYKKIKIKINVGKKKLSTFSK